MIRPRGYKTFFMLNSVEDKILNVHKYENIKKLSIFQTQISLECFFSCPYMLKCQQFMPTIVGILTFMSRKNFMLNSVEHEKSFITSGPDCVDVEADLRILSWCSSN